MRPKSDDRTFLLTLDEGLSNAGVLPEHSIVCAVSGGFDSTALLLGCNRLQYRYRNLTAAHYNHQTRGEESDGDEEFIRNLCADAGIALHVGRSNHLVENLDENSARQERYAFLAKTSDEVGAEAILVAHTVEDQAETALLRIARGAGIERCWWYADRPTHAHTREPRSEYRSPHASRHTPRRYKLPQLPPDIRET